MVAPALGWKHATGVFLGEDRVVVTTVARTPLGAKRLESCEEPVSNGDVTGAIERLRSTGRLKGALVCGIDPRRVFTVTRRLSPEEAGKRPAELLAARLGSTEDSLVAGRETVKVPGGTCTVLVACPRPLVAPLLAGLETTKLDAIKLIPVASALYEEAVHLKARGRRHKTELRVLPGEDSGLALLAHNGTLLASRMFWMSGPEDSQPISLALLSLVTHAREELGLPGVDVALLHAGSERAALAKACETDLSIPTQLAPALAPEPDVISRALAVAGTRPRPGAMDLLQDLRPPPGLRAIFPLKAACVLGLIVGASAYLLHGEASQLAEETAKLEKKAAKDAKIAKVSLKELDKAHEAMALEFTLADSFIARRIFWSELMQELPGVMPATSTVLDLDGRDGVHYPSSKKKKGGGPAPSANLRQLTVAAEVPLDAADTSPPEVQMLTDALKASPYFQREFPRVNGANVRLLPAVKGLAARITVSCFPKAGS